MLAGAGRARCASWSREDPALGDLVLRAFLLRRELLIGLGAGLHDRRLALLAGHPPPARVRGAQPAAAPLDRPRATTPTPRRCCARLGRRAGGDAGRDLGRREVLRNPSNAELAARGRAARRAAATSASRPGRRRRRAGRAGGRGLRRLGGAARRSRSTRSPTGGQAAPRRGSRTTSASPPGSRAPSWPSARRSRRASSAPGSSRCRPRSALEPATDGHTIVDSTTARRSRRGRVVIATGARYRRLAVPRLEEFEGGERLLRRDADGGADLRRRPRSPSSAAATRPGRRPLFLSRRAARSRWSSARRADQRHVALPRRPDRAHAATSRCCCTPRSRELLGDDGARGVVVEDNCRPASAAAARGPRAVRLHRRRAAHGLARRTRSRSTTTATS